MATLQCSHCGKKYTSRQMSVLRTHERMHTGELPYACLHDGCEKRFSRKDCMMVHYHKHSVIHTCPVESCKMTFGSAIDLYRHRRFHSSMCTLCGESFETLPFLRAHKLKVHGESDFRCAEGERNVIRSLDNSSLYYSHIRVI
jgi:KRAB domain-containing zinc finger protein